MEITLLKVRPLTDDEIKHPDKYDKGEWICVKTEDEEGMSRLPAELISMMDLVDVSTAYYDVDAMREVANVTDEYKLDVSATNRFDKMGENTVVLTNGECDLYFEADKYRMVFHFLAAAGEEVCDIEIPEDMEAFFSFPEYVPQYLTQEVYDFLCIADRDLPCLEQPGEEKIFFVINE